MRLVPARADEETLEIIAKMQGAASGHQTVLQYCPHRNHPIAQKAASDYQRLRLPRLYLSPNSSTELPPMHLTLLLLLLLLPRHKQTLYTLILWMRMP
jgi:hypothetical protein